MRVVLALNLALVAALVAVGVSARSVAVLAEGVDYFADAAAIGGTLLALRLSGRAVTHPRQGRFPQAAVVAALVNGGWLLLLSILVSASAAWRLISGVQEVHGLPVLVVSAIAALSMGAGALLLGGDADGDRDEDGDDSADGGAGLAMRSVLLDTAADAAAAAGVALTGAVILVTGSLFWLDPAVALAIAVVVAYHAVRLLLDVVGRMRAGTQC